MYPGLPHQAPLTVSNLTFCYKLISCFQNSKHICSSGLQPCDPEEGGDQDSILLDFEKGKTMEKRKSNFRY